MLRELRRAAGDLTLTQAAELTGFSIAKISRIENGRNIPRVADVQKLTEAYQVDPATRAHVVTLAEQTKESFRRIVLASRADRAAFQRRLAELDRQSERIREFTPTLVPGLLQTAEYMRAVFTSAGGTPEAINAAVAARLDRQAVLDESGRRISVITTEGALGWGGGPPRMMARQIEHIAEMAARADVRVGVIPFGAQARVFPVSTWTLYDERAVVPGVLAAQVVLTGSRVRPYVEQYQLLEPVAVFGDDARRLLDRVASRYREL